jgi:hypothetical protein
MRRSLKSVLARLNHITARLEADVTAVDIAAVLIEARRRAAERKRRFEERGYPETAAERYARHLERKPKASAGDAPRSQTWFWERQHAVWARLELEYAAEAAREAAGYSPRQDPPWWSQTDDQLRQSARGSVEGSMVVSALVRMRRERIERIINQ